MFTWYRDITRTERVTFWTCLGGWALDALDVQMFSLVIPALVATWHVSNTEAGLVGGVTLVTSAMGGWLGGALSDRIGRVRALQVTVLWFALATFIAAFTQSFEQLLVTKAIQGFGFGAEWAAAPCLWRRSSAPSIGARRWAPCKVAGPSGGAPPYCSTPPPSRFPGRDRVARDVRRRPAAGVADPLHPPFRHRADPRGRSPGRSPASSPRCSACSRRKHCGSR